MSDKSGKDQVSIRLAVQQEPLSPPRGPMMRLARRMGLDVWGESLLGRRVGTEMSGAALVLLAVLLFEFFAWSMLFNVLVHSSEWKVSVRTLLALALGVLFSAVVYIFERSLIIADFTESSKNKYLAYGIRLFVIGISALATAQPVELLVFGGAIERRLHEELILREAIHQVEELRKDKLDEVPLSESEIEAKIREKPEYRNIESTASEAESSKGQVLALQERVRSTMRAKNEAEAEVTRLDGLIRISDQQVNNTSDEEEKRQLRDRVDSLRSQLATARSRISVRQGEIEIAQQALNEATGREGLANQEAEDARAEFARLLDAERLGDKTKVEEAKNRAQIRKDWLLTIRQAEPGTALTNPLTNSPLPPKTADFTDRLRVLDDLRNAMPPQWPRSPIELREKANQEFNLGASATDAMDPADPLVARLKADAKYFEKIYYIAFIVALIIPLLTLAFKLMMSRQLRSYYSARDQAHALNPEAVQAIYAERDTRSK